MKKILFLFLAVSGLCGFSDLAGISGGISVEAENDNWQVTMRSSSVVRAYNPDEHVEILVNIGPLLPNSPQCLSNKRIKDIKFSLNIYKVAEPGDTDWAKSFEKTKISFYRPGGAEERKIYGSNLVKNNLRFKPGTIVNVGSLEFLSPFTCGEIDGMSMRIYGMRSGRRTLPDLTFELQIDK